MGIASEVTKVKRSLRKAAHVDRQFCWSLPILMIPTESPKHSSATTTPRRHRRPRRHHPSKGTSCWEHCGGPTERWVVLWLRWCGR